MQIPKFKEIERIVWESEEKLLGLLNSLPVCLAFIDKEQIYQFNNKTYEEWFGRSIEEIRGAHIRDVMGENVYESIREHIEKALSGKNVSYQTEIPKREGIRLFETNLVPCFDTDGDVEGCIVHSEDITENRLEQEKLRESEARFRTLFDNGPEAMVVIDVDAGKFMDANPKALQLFGCTRDEFIGLGPLDISPPFQPDGRSSKDAAEEKIRERIRNNPKPFEWVHKNSSGQEILCEIRPSKLPAADRNLFCGIAIDITVMKQVEMKLKASEERLRSFMDNSPAFMYIKDSSLKHLHANRSLLEYFNISIDEFIGSAARDFFPEDIAKKLEGYDRLVIEKRVPVETNEFRFTPHGKLLYFREIKFPVTLYPGEVGVGGIVLDITALKLTEQSLKEQLEFEQLIANIAALLAQTKPEELEDSIDSMLKTLGQFLKTERAFLAQFSEDGKRLMFTNTWAAEGFSPLSQIFQMNLVTEIPWVTKQISTGRVIKAGPGLTGLPHEANKLRIQLEHDGINSGVVVPVVVEGRSIGMLGLDTSKQPREYPQAIVDRLLIVADMIGITLDRIRAEEAINEQMRFEDLISRLSATFIHIKAGDIDKNIERGLQLIAKFLDVQRVNLFQFSHNLDVLTLTHSWAEERVKNPPKTVFNNRHPWFTQKLFQRESFCFTTPDDLPKEANAEKEYLKQQGIKSALIVPLVAEGAAHGCITLSDMKRERQWSDKILHQMLPLSEVFLNALLRQKADEKMSRNLMEIKHLKEHLEKENIYLREKMEATADYGKIVAESDAMQDVLKKAEQVAETDSTVLIMGETGTGKELLACAIHNLSRRKDRTMVKVNCAALPSTLIENELFGREKGAYTGALSRQAGRFEVADGSTIFLDEIGELSQELQAKLLRVLQDGQFERLGSTRTIKVDARVIAATNRDLEKAVKEGTFREDLYYRLKVFPINIPPLRERPEDIAPLVWSIVKELGKTMGKRIEDIKKQNINEMLRYHWPGNVRELRNMIEQAMITSRGKTLNIQVPKMLPENHACNLKLKDAQREHILSVLEKTRWRVSGKNGAAETLGLKESTLRARMKKLGIKRPT